jgi:hypothetical protein
MIEKDETIQFTVTMGKKDYEDLRDWAHAHSRTIAEYAAQVLANRAEANIDVIEKLRERSNRE